MVQSKIKKNHQNTLLFSKKLEQQTMTTTATSIQIIYFTIIAINALIFIPIISYYLYKLWNLRKQPLIFKREPNLSMFAIICYFIHIIIFRPIADLPAILSSIDFGESELYIRLFMYNTIFIPFTIYLCRIWLLYYDYNLELYLCSQQWKSKLIHDQVRTSRGWTVQHQKLLSNKLVFKIILDSIRLDCFCFSMYCSKWCNSNIVRI